MNIKPYWLTLILALGATDRAYPSACSVPNSTDGHTRFPVRTSPPLNPFSVPITRIFGSGNAQHYTSDGQLLNLQQAIADGLIGPRAKLEYTISVTVAPGLYSSLYAFQQLGIVNSQLIGIPLAAASASGTSSEFARVQLSIQPKLNGASVGGKQAFSIPITPAGASASIRQCVSFDVAAISPRVGRLGAGATEDPNRAQMSSRSTETSPRSL